MNRRYFLWIVGGLAFFGALSVAMFLQAGSYLEAPAQNVRAADLLVALGGDNGDRVRRVAELYKQGYATNVLLTGLESSPHDTRRHYLNWRAQFLIDAGIPRDAIIFDEVSANTWDEAVNTLRLMKARGWKQVLVVSDPPHMRRLSWVWERVFAGSGREYSLIATQPNWWDTEHWWRNELAAKNVLSELIKMGYYHIAY